MARKAMSGNGRVRISPAIRASPRSHTRSIPRSSLETSTRCYVADRGRHVRAHRATPSVIGIIQFGDKSSAASGVHAMTRHSENTVPVRVDREIRMAVADERASSMAMEVREGLSRRQKELPPKYFYDE